MGVGGMSVKEDEDDDDGDNDDDGTSVSSGSATEGVVADAEVGIAGVAYSRLGNAFAATLAVFGRCELLHTSIEPLEKQEPLGAVHQWVAIKLYTIEIDRKHFDAWSHSFLYCKLWSSILPAMQTHKLLSRMRMP